MSTNMTPGERVTRLAHMILQELVSDKVNIDLDKLTERFRAACLEARVDPRVLLTKASHDLCAVQPGFEERLRLRVRAVEGIAIH